MDREQKTFLALLWAFLLGTLIFFILFLSLGRIYLPTPVWVMLLLLDLGFIVFLFVPRVTKSLFDPRSGRRIERGWYPHTLSEILEGGEDGGGGNARAPVRAVSPVPLIPLILMIVPILLSVSMIPDESDWNRREADRIGGIYDDAYRRLGELETVSSEAGEVVSAHIGDIRPSEMGREARRRLMHWCDSLAGTISRRLEPFNEMGLQVFSSRGERVAWGGRPRFFGRIGPQGVGRRLFTDRTQLYTLLVLDAPLGNGGRVVVDIPVEVNYFISNQFLRSTSIGEYLAEEYGEEVELNFSLGRLGGRSEHGGYTSDKTDAQILFNPNEGVKAYGVIKSSIGPPIAGLMINGRSYDSVSRRLEGRRILWAGVTITLIVIIIARWVYRRYGKRRPRGEAGSWILLKRTLMLLGFLVVIRFLLLRLEIPGSFLDVSLFDPALFADNIPGGLTRTAGDFLVTSLFALIMVFGSVKTFRTNYPGSMERGFVSGRRISWPGLLAKSLGLTAVLAVSLYAVSNIVSRVVLNANPRLIGLDVEFFELSVVVLHMALLFSVSAVFIAAIALTRLIMVSGNAGAAEAAIASVLALVPLGVLFDLGLMPLICGVGLLALSSRVFPLLKKEDVTSVIFSSFFLVLICSLAVFGVAEDEYEELRKNRVMEKLHAYNYPDDNWLQAVLPDLCEEVTADRSIFSRILLKRESTAFELWAKSALSSYRVSCMIEVYDDLGERFSTFEVGMPYEPPRSDARDRWDGDGPGVTRVEQDTRDGKVYYFRGTAPIVQAGGKEVGRVEVTIPYFFENPELLAQTGPMAPAILQNIERGSIAPRIDEPEDLLVARLAGRRIAASSTPMLPSGTVLPAYEGDWLDLEVGSLSYTCAAMEGDEGACYLVGYRSAGLLEALLQWAAVVSLDIVLTVISLVGLFIVRRLPILGSVTPAVSFETGLGFRQKIIFSFLAVSVLPVLILGIFSNRFIEGRYRGEGEREAISGVKSASAMIEHTIESGAVEFAASQYIDDILNGDVDAAVRDISMNEEIQFTLLGTDGEVLLDESLGDLDRGDVQALLGGEAHGKIFTVYDPPYLYGATVVPVSSSNGRAGYLFYRRRLDDGFIGGVAGVLGKNINVYYSGLIRASSERELFMGGFLNPLVASDVYANVALEGSGKALFGERLGDYSYQVASSPIASMKGAENAILTVPMLYRSELVEKELRKTYTLILGLLALLLVATVILGVFLAGKIFTPIAALWGGTRRIINGDLEFMLEAEAPDEVGELVDSFNTMTGALREARHGLMERQRYLATVLDNVATGVIAVGAEGEIITLNPAGERILDTSRELVVGKRPDEIEGDALRPLMGLFARGAGGSVEREITLAAGGKRRTVKAVVTGLEDGEERLGTVIVFDDLTELIRSKKLSAWIEMARQIAHEVKNPLTPIRLSTQLMSRAYAEGSEEFGEIFESGVETVIKQIEILRRIASEFSSFGRVAEMDIGVIDLDPFMEDFLSAYRGAENVDIRFRPGEGLKVLADGEGLRKILVNLMENALDAMPSGGEVDVGCSVSGGVVEVTIADSGTGIAPELQDKLFEPYFSTKTNGTGLGLAICRNLAREMDGDIVLGNVEHGMGVKAVVTLPLAD